MLITTLIVICRPAWAQEAEQPENLALGAEYEVLTARSYGRTRESDLIILTDGAWGSGYWTRDNTMAWRVHPGFTAEVLVDLGASGAIAGVSVAAVHGRAAHPPEVTVRVGESMDRLHEVVSWDPGEGLEVAPDGYQTLRSPSPEFRAAGRYVLFTMSQPPERPGGPPRSGLICVTELMVHPGDFDAASVEMPGEAIDLEAYMAEKDPYRFIPPISTEVETPHIDWAPRPAGGRPDVLTVIQYVCARDAVELEQRVGMNQRIFALLRQEPRMGYFRTRELLAELGVTPDVLLLAGIDWAILRPEARDRILELVRGGMGLLWVHPRGEGDDLRALLDALPERRFPVLDSPLETMPFPLLEDLRDGAFGDLRCGTIGHGRVAAWRYENPDGERFVDMNSALWPQMPGRNTPEDFPAWEIYAAHLAKVLGWVAHGEPAARLGAIEVMRADADGIELTCPVEGEGVRLRAVLLDEHGREVAATNAAPPALSFERALQTGAHCVIVWLEDGEGRQVDWRCALAHVDGPGIAEIALDRDRYERGDELTATVRCEAAEGLTVRAELRDGYEGLVAAAQADAAPDVEVTLPTELSRSLTCMMHVTLRDGERLVDERFSPVPTIFEADLAEYQVGLWASYGSYIGKRHWGYQMLQRQVPLLADFAIGGHPPGYPRYGMRPCPENMHRIYFKLGERYEKMNLAEPGFRERFLETIRPRIEGAHNWGAFDFSVGDECGYTLRRDEHTLAAFRAWLRERHGTIDRLNKRWGTTLTSFEAIEFVEDPPPPQGLAERTFGDWLFADTLMAARGLAEEVDPRNRLGISGTRDPAHYIGFDWWRLMNTLTHLAFYDGLQRDCIRSWRKPGDLVTGFVGYDYADTNEVMARYFPWLEVFSGMQGVSLYSASSGDLGGYVRPDLTLTNRARWHIEEVAELKSGIGKALLTADRSPAPIALHYSQRSIHLANMLGRPALANLTSIAEIIKDLGLQFDFVSHEQLEAGMLSERGYRVFILPDSLALSDAEIAALEGFVHAGGLLLTFGDCGAFNEYGKEREATDVEALRWREPEQPLDPTALEDAITRTEIGEGARVDCDFLLAEYREFRPSGIAGETVDRLSAGAELSAAWLVLAEELLGEAEIAPPAVVRNDDGSPRRYVEVVQFERGPIRYLGVLPRYFGGRSSRSIAPLSIDEDDFSSAVIELPAVAHVYDVRSGDYLGRTDRIEATLATGVAQLYALAPYRTTGVTIDCPERVQAGGTLTARCAVAAAGVQAGDHVVHWTLAGPDGTVLPPYARNTLAERGVGGVSFRLTLDMSGAWTLTARDVISGEIATQTVEIKAAR